MKDETKIEKLIDKLIVEDVAVINDLEWLIGGERNGLNDYSTLVKHLLKRIVDLERKVEGLINTTKQGVIGRTKDKQHTWVSFDHRKSNKKCVTCGIYKIGTYSKILKATVYHYSTDGHDNIGTSCECTINKN